MRQQEDRIQASGLQVVVITFEKPLFVNAYIRETGTSWPILIDQTRGLYQAYGMLRGRGWDIFGPAAVWTYFKLLLRGRRVQRNSDDVHQLGGDVLIDASGIVRLHYIGRGPADRPSVTSILQRVEDQPTATVE